MDEMPRLADLDGVLPRGIRFGDIDGAVELNGYLLLLEIKRHSTELKTAQKWMHENLSKSVSTGIVVQARNPDGYDTEWGEFRVFQAGKALPIERGGHGLAELREAVRKWGEWALSQKPAWTRWDRPAGGTP